jgi:hypothetical protein
MRMDNKKGQADATVVSLTIIIYLYLCVSVDGSKRKRTMVDCWKWKFMQKENENFSTLWYSYEGNCSREWRSVLNGWKGQRGNLS